MATGCSSTSSNSSNSSSSSSSASCNCNNISNNHTNSSSSSCCNLKHIKQQCRISTGASSISYMNNLNNNNSTSINAAAFNSNSYRNSYINGQTVASSATLSSSSLPSSQQPSAAYNLTYQQDGADLNGHHLYPDDFNDFDPNAVNSTSTQSLKIKTKSIENTLLPLVNQISTLVNFKDNYYRATSSNTINTLSTPTGTFYSERTANALLRVGEAVNLAVERFVSVGEAIALENPTIKLDMLEACKEAKHAGFAIKIHTQMPTSMASVIGLSTTGNNSEKLSMIQAANILLNSVTKVLLLADIVIINQILNSKNKVLLTLTSLENVIDLYSFINLFTQYGADLIELAHLSGERQNDLKDDKRKSQLSSARWILEKSTVMILSSTKAYLKHIECESAKENVSLVYSFLHQALDTLHYVIVDSGSMFDYSSPIYCQNNSSIFKSSIVQISFVNAFRQFEDALDLVRNNLISETNGENLVLSALNILIDSTQDFTDSLYINNDQRERIIRLQNEISEKTIFFLKDTTNQEQNSDQQDQYDQNIGTCSSSLNTDPNNNNLTNKFNNKIFKCSPILNDCEVLKKLLQSQTMQLANCLFRENQDATLLNCIKTYSLSNHYDLLIETLEKFKEYSDHVLELCKLLRHISTIDVFEVTCEHHFNVFENLAKMIQSAAGTAAMYPTCKSANENLNLYCESWENQVNDLSVLVKEMQELINGVKSNKSVYLSLPRPGKHGTSARLSNSTSTKPSKLDSTEQAKIAKLGLEMKLIQSEIEAEADKWNEPQNEIVKLAKLMSEMAYEIHLFTRGEGTLKTTQDLFSRAEVFLQHGVLLYGIIKEFLAQVPNGYLKDELIQLLDKLPNNFKQLKNRLKQVTVGKTATFNKVDWVIQETRDFMNLVAKLVTNCFLCCTKYNISYEQARQTNVIDQSQDYMLSNQLQESLTLNNHNHINRLLIDQDQSIIGNDTSLLTNDLPIYMNASTLNPTQSRLRSKSYLINNPHYRFSNYAPLSSSSPHRSDSCGPSLRAQSLHRTFI